MIATRLAACVIVSALFVGQIDAAASEEIVDRQTVTFAAEYPLRALREGRQGIVYFTLIVGPDGVPKSCSVTTSSGHMDLDNAACQSAMRSARFSRADAASPSDRLYQSKTEFKIEE
ncbi:energy transducer TonB [Sphingorhabdus sp.]|uniref:energy transducer TonB n=1 Tax=Sphingorhabdus sp. TaxID=1902408 RepID=UPI003CC69441